MVVSVRAAAAAAAAGNARVTGHAAKKRVGDGREEVRQTMRKHGHACRVTALDAYRASKTTCKAGKRAGGGGWR